jgi:putative transposase
MVQREAFRFELLPTGEQARDMRSFAGSHRYVYNEALKFQQARTRAVRIS